MTRIAISYRRDDSDAITGRIFDRLVAHYGREAVFRDIDDIPLGIDFRDYIAAMLHKSDVVLVVIGPRWAGARGGRSRIADPADPVRIEVETSLRMGIPVVPVLVGRAGMPKVEQLPDSLKDLAYRNGLRVDAAQDFDHHLDRLLRALDKLLADRKSVPAAGQAAERAAADPASSEGGASSGMLPALSKAAPIRIRRRPTTTGHRWSRRRRSFPPRPFRHRPPRLKLRLLLLVLQRRARYKEMRLNQRLTQKKSQCMKAIFIYGHKKN